MNSPDASAPQLREEILRLVSRYHEVAHAPKPFVPGETKIPYAGRVYDDEEMRLGVESILQFWLTAGPFANQFEKQMRDRKTPIVKLRHCMENRCLGAGPVLIHQRTRIDVRASIE